MRRIDQLPAPVIAGVALDMAGVLVFLASPDPIVWPLALTLVAFGSLLLHAGLPAAGLGQGPLDPWLRRLRWVAAAMALVIPFVALLGHAGRVPAIVALAAAGAVHGVVWVAAIPWSRPAEGLEPIAGLVYLIVATIMFVCVPAAALVDRAHVDRLAVMGVVSIYAWSLYLLAPCAPVAEDARGLARLSAAATWGAFGLVMAPFSHAAAPDLAPLWSLAAIAIAGWAALGMSRGGLPVAGIGAAGLVAVLVAGLALDRGPAAIPEAAVLAAAALAWIAVATRTGAFHLGDPLAIAAGIALAAASAGDLSSRALGTALEAGDAPAIATAIAGSALRAGYLVALAVRAIRGARTGVPRAIARV